MLYMATKAFDIDNGVRVVPGDIVDVTGWKVNNVRGMLENNYLKETRAEKATVDPNLVTTPVIDMLPNKRRSPQGKRVFTRMG